VSTARTPIIPLRNQNPRSGQNYFWLILGAPIVTFILTAVGTAIFIVGLLFVGDVGSLFVEFTSLLLLMFLLMSVGQCFMYPATALLAYLLLKYSGRLSLSRLMLFSPVIALLTWFGFKFVLPLVPIPMPTPDNLFAEHPVATFLIEFAMSWIWTIVILLGYWWPFRNVGKSEPTADTTVPAQ
jgi:hypothetical protein